MIKALEYGAFVIDMQCNANKTVCMVFLPKDKRKSVASAFPRLVLNGIDLQYVSEFKYLGHIISNDKTDNKDVLREVRLLFTRANVYLIVDLACVLYLLRLLCFAHFVFVFVGCHCGRDIM